MPVVDGGSIFVGVVNNWSHSVVSVSDVVDEDCVLVHARSSTESTLLCLRSDGREGVGDDRNEQINEPKVQNDDADNKKEK
jgi:hypothetical protein